MSEMDKACAKLRDLLNNPFAVERLEKELNPKWEHPGWKELKLKNKKVKVVRK